jgi:hypothetical protein
VVSEEEMKKQEETGEKTGDETGEKTGEETGGSGYFASIDSSTLFLASVTGTYEIKEMNNII